MAAKLKTTPLKLCAAGHTPAPVHPMCGRWGDLNSVAEVEMLIVSSGWIGVPQPAHTVTEDLFFQRRFLLSIYVW